MIKSYDEYLRIFEDQKHDLQISLYERFDEWLFGTMKDDIKDSLIEWHKVESEGLLRPDDIDEGESVLVCWAEHQDWDFQRMHIEITGDGWYWACDESPYYGDEWDGNLPTHYAFNPALPKPPKE